MTIAVQKTGCLHRLASSQTKGLVSFMQNGVAALENWGSEYLIGGVGIEARSGLIKEEYSGVRNKGDSDVCSLGLPACNNNSKECDSPSGGTWWPTVSQAHCLSNKHKVAGMFKSPELPRH